eukprot:TRINITY_DN9174_c0_g2_i1.p1 TRINITY_DN9174_c0_g2~~TRINITY_DN9174_c0_g2_i1.p1  ORF type:complete len:676 (+),score=254.49 TRINITY_DN9174_c0_g2_i1:76-2103(+)
MLLIRHGVSRCAPALLHAGVRWQSVHPRHGRVPPPPRLSSEVDRQMGGGVRGVRSKQLEKRDALLREIRTLCTRSSSVRAEVKALICESQDDIVINKMEYFFDNYSFKDKEIARFESCKGDTEETLDEFYRVFADWFYMHEAPRYSDMHRPWEWFPKARYMRRRIYFHAGPTNSGKTYESLERMMKARSGVYCAPLKLLAAQVCEKVNKAGVPCELVIGDEVIFNGSGEFISCTVEMCPLDETIDVGIIDEIQMIGDNERGWAWTRALLGLPAREIHLCGEPRAIPVIKKLLRAVGEEESLRIMWHERLVPLKITEPLSGDLRKVERGDCIVTFSRKQVYNIKNQIEEARPGLKVNIVYGALPHDVREAQTSEFNKVGDGANSVLVATDAIAFGLNLNIRRIIFSTVQKFTQGEMRALTHANVLQIGGRAGRAGCAFADCGYVTSLHNRDTAYVRKAFEQGAGELIQRAGLIPTADILGVYWNLHQDVASYYDLLKMFIKEVETEDIFFVCDMTRQMLPIAEMMEGLSFPIQEKIVISFVPWGDRSEEGAKLLRGWLEAHDREEVVHVGFDAPTPGTLLQDLERMFKWTECYGWLAMRFPMTFTQFDKCKHIKDSIVNLMKAELSRSDEDWQKVHAASAVGDVPADFNAKPIQDRRLVDLSEGKVRSRLEDLRKA